MKFVFDLLSTGALAFGLFLLLLVGVAITFPIFALGQWLFKTPFVSKNLGTLWQRGSVIGIGMFCYGIYYGINYILHH
jgi:Sec-independent protein secretion pathway component TatC